MGTPLLLNFTSWCKTVIYKKAITMKTLGGNIGYRGTVFEIDKLNCNSLGCVQWR